MGRIKVPTLRNIEETAPYYHNGTVWQLDESVEIMANTQLGMHLSKTQISEIVLFLKTLTGRKPEIVIPTLPKRAPLTPKPKLDLLK